MGEDAGELPGKLFSSHCLEKEPIKLKGSNTEEIGNYPYLPQRSEWQTLIIEETETSPTKSLAVLQVTGTKGSLVRESEATNKERVIIGSQECLLSSTDEGIE